MSSDKNVLDFIDVHSVEVVITKAMTTFGWRRRLFDFATSCCGLSESPRDMVSYENVAPYSCDMESYGPKTLTCLVYFVDEKSSLQCRSLVMNEFPPTLLTIRCASVKRSPSLTVVSPRIHYDHLMYPSPDPSLSLVTSVGANQEAALLQPVQPTFRVENIHVLPKSQFPQFANAVFKGYSTLNQAMDGHNDSGIPFCYPKLVNGCIRMVFFNKDAIRCHDFVVGTEVNHEGKYPFAQTQVQPDYAHAEVFEQACLLREKLIIPIWAALERNPDMKLKHNFAWGPDPSAQWENWDQLTRGLFYRASVRDRLTVTWCERQRAVQVYEWHGTVEFVHKGPDGQNMLLFMKYDMDETNMYVLPNMAVRVLSISQLEDPAPAPLV